MRFLKYPSLGVALCCVSAPVLAVETGVSAGITTQWTDNVRLSEDNRESDWLETLNLGANLDGSDTFYQYGTRYDVSYEHYQNGSYGDNSYYNGNAFINLFLLPGRITWYFGVQSETTLLKSTVPNTPDNRDQRTMYTTSPSLTLILLPRDQVVLSGQATKVDYRESAQSDSDRAGGNLQWVHTLSPLTQLTATASQQQVNFDTATDYESVSYQLGIKRRINGGSVDVAGGKNTIKPVVGDQLDGSNYQANIRWNDEVHAWGFQAYRDLTDTSIGLSGNFDTTGFITPSEIDTSQVELVTRTRYNLDYTFTPIRTFSVNANVYWDDERVQNNVRDTLRKGGGLTFTRELTQGTRVRANYGYEHTDTDEASTLRTDIVRRYRVTLERDFQKRLRVSGWIGRQEADSSDHTTKYEEHVVGIDAVLTI